MPERTPWIICGRLIGTATGADRPAPLVLQIYDLEPAEGYIGPVAHCTIFDLERGRIEAPVEGMTTGWYDLIDSIKGAPRA